MHDFLHFIDLNILTKKITQYFIRKFFNTLRQKYVPRGKMFQYSHIAYYCPDAIFLIRLLGLSIVNLKNANHLKKDKEKMRKMKQKMRKRTRTGFYRVMLLMYIISEYWEILSHKDLI